jgi:hypothetical protein
LNAPNRTRKRSVATLTVRDLRILAAVTDRSPLPLDALTGHFGARKTALNRLRSLVLAGYLTSERKQVIDRPAPVLFYTPTRKATDALRRISAEGQRFDHA